MLKKLAIIVFIGLLLVMSGCSLLRMSYNNAPQLAWWWLDGYVGFSREQEPHVKQAIHRWFDWHRASQLPHYADWLAAIRSRISGPLTAGQVCTWSDELQAIIAPAIDHAAGLSSPVVLSLREAQWRHLEQRFAKSNDELRDDFLQEDLKKRRKASIKRTIKRIKNLYGDIDEAQRRLVIASLEASPFDPGRWLSERQRRQQVILQTFNRLAAEAVPAGQVTPMLRQLIEHAQRSDDPEYRAYQLKLVEHTCDFIARMHNSTTDKQRQYAHDKLKGWEADLRALTAEGRMAAIAE